jgi:hypothetical protein
MEDNAFCFRTSKVCAHSDDENQLRYDHQLQFYDLDTLSEKSTLNFEGQDIANYFIIKNMMITSNSKQMINFYDKKGNFIFDMGYLS